MIGKSLFQRRRRQPKNERPRQLLITAERTENYVIQQRPLGEVHALCVICGVEVGYLTFEQATRLTGLAARMIFLLVEAEEVHSYETVEGHLLLCPNSIAEFIRL